MLNCILVELNYFFLGGGTFCNVSLHEKIGAADCPQCTVTCQFVNCLFRLRYEKDHIINMKHEKERLDTICDQEEAQIQKLKKVLDIVRM